MQGKWSGILVAAVAACAWLGAPGAAHADTRADKTEVITAMANKLAEAAKSKYGAVTKKPRVVIAGVSSAAKSMEPVELLAVIDKFETKLSKMVVLLDREKSAVVQGEQAFQQSGAVKDSDIAKLGGKYGAAQLLFISFKDTVARQGGKDEEVTLTAKITAIEVETQRVVFNELLDLTFEHWTWTESYYIRDTVSFAFGTAKWVTGIAAMATGYMWMNDYSKYNAATNAKDAKGYRESSQKYSQYAGISTVLWITTLYVQDSIDSADRNNEIYHKYRLGLAPWTPSGPEVAIAWNF